MQTANQTKDTIKAATVAVMRSKKVDLITVNDIVEEAHVSRSTFYRYYDSIANIVEELENNFLENIRDINRYTISTRFEKEGIEASLDTYIHLFEYIRDNADFYLAMMDSRGNENFSRKIHEIIREYYLGKIAYEGMHSPDQDLYFTFAVGGHDALVAHWLKKRQDVSVDEFACHMQKLMYSMYRT